MSCETIDVEIQEQGGTTVCVQPFSATALLRHAPTHYSGNSDPLNHNQLSGLQGGQNEEYYHLSNAQLTSIVNLNSGIASFNVDIPSGIQQMSVPFPKTFSNIPVIVSNILSPYDYTFLTSISSVTTTGFNILFSHRINNTGFKLINLAYTV